MRWILAALGAGQLAGFSAPVPALASSLRVPPGRIGFTAVPPETSGVTFTNALSAQRHLTNQILLNGSGVAAGDVNGDGRPDLYFCNLDGPNALYLNLGNWRFREAALEAGVSCAGMDATGAVLADLDGDGDLDLLVGSTGSGTQVFHNDGAGKFTRSPQQLNEERAGTSKALADIDGNGTLDLYQANYRRVTLRDQPNTAFRFKMVNGKPEVSSINGRPLTDPDLTNRFLFRIKVENGRVNFGSDEQGEPDAIFLNDGQGHFTPLPLAGAFSDEEGLPLQTPPFDWGLSVMVRDLDGNGSPDIYVCNDFQSPDRIWMNDGQGRFRALPRGAIRQTSLSSMGVDVADVNRDGHMDIFVADMLSRSHARRLSQRTDLAGEPSGAEDSSGRLQYARNTLFAARGDGTFAEVAQFAGLEAAEWAWTPLFLDVDLDGYEDLLVSNGFERDGMNVDVLREIEARKSMQKLPASEQLGLRRLFPRLDTPNAAFRNLGNFRFQDVSADWRFDLQAVSQGMALADLDGDGDLDVIVSNMNAPASLYRNDAPAPRIAVRLQGRAPNTRGVGARISVTGGPVAQSQEMIAGGRYLSSDDFMRTFAAGSAGKLRIEVTWRNGRRTVVEDARPNHLYTVQETAAETAARPSGDVASSLFQDVTRLLAHRHADEQGNDFARQPLLPKKVGRSGPGMGWADINADGWDDLMIGGGTGGRVESFLNKQGTAFERIPSPFADRPGTEQPAVLAWNIASNDVVLLAGSFREAAGGAIRQASGKAKDIPESELQLSAAPGPLSMADIDNDGDLDLFVGGRAPAGRYPQSGSSALFRSADGALHIDPTNALLLSQLGLVNGSVFTDFDNDGDPDLALACEWGALRLLRNDAGRFTDITQTVGLDKYRGWWNGIAAGDFDGDGRLDLVASNWGENSRYQRYLDKPLRLYHGDVEGDGVVELLEAHYEPSLSAYAPHRNLDSVVRGMPWLRARFTTWASFSVATVDDILGEHRVRFKVSEADWLASTLFLNRGQRFEAVRLPDEAQFAPAFGICIADFDVDGHEDLFLAQNFFGVTADTSRYDSGRGLMLRGDGKGGLVPMSGMKSGIILDGEQRGAAVSDFDQDGRPDLVVAQNSESTRLFRNAAGLRGLRVKLRGTNGNPSGVGAALRIGDGSTFGPARELHAGAGYLSQDSSVAILARTGNNLQVRWPGGRQTISRLPESALEIEVRPDGTVATVK